MDDRKTHPKTIYSTWIATLAIGLIAVALIRWQRTPVATNLSSDSTTVAQVLASGEESSGPRTAWKFATTIRRPEGPPVIELQTPDPQGRVGSVACSTCHSVREPDLSNQRPDDLQQFHQNMKMAHGTTTCYSCHHPEDMDSLRLADTSQIEYSDVMTLCAQCHGTQATDYAHGAHGGMSGYWDLTRGPRTRNNCIDCHDPHVPKFPSMTPNFKPRDRFLDSPLQSEGDRSRESEIEAEIQVSP